MTRSRGCSIASLFFVGKKIANAAAGSEAYNSIFFIA